MTGVAIRTEAASAASQSSVGAIATAGGWVPVPEDGYTASATPAASAVGSPPATRVVFLVATAGKPSFWPAWGVLAWTPITGPRISWGLPPPQPAIRADTATAASRRLLGIAARTLASRAAANAACA